MATVQGRAGAGSNRGRAVNPDIERVSRPGREVEGAPSVEMAAEEAVQRPWPKMPDTWQASELEWIVYWWFKYDQEWVEGEDFYYNGLAFAPGLYTSSPFTQADFIIDLGPNSRAGAILPYTAIVLDPFTEFTHDIETDRKRREALLNPTGDNHYLLIFLAEEDVKNRTDFIIRQALEGTDHSNRR